MTFERKLVKRFPNDKLQRSPPKPGEMTSVAIELGIPPQASFNGVPRNRGKRHTINAKPCTDFSLLQRSPPKPGEMTSSFTRGWHLVFEASTESPQTGGNDGQKHGLFLPYAELQRSPPKPGEMTNAALKVSRGPHSCFNGVPQNRRK